MMRMMVCFIPALGGVLTWWLVDLTMNWLFTADTHTAAFPTFMAMWWGLYMGKHVTC